MNKIIINRGDYNIILEITLSDEKYIAPNDMKYIRGQLAITNGVNLNWCALSVRGKISDRDWWVEKMVGGLSFKSINDIEYLNFVEDMKSGIIEMLDSYMNNNMSILDNK